MTENEKVAYMREVDEMTMEDLVMVGDDGDGYDD
jgi:hypothetical protein